MNGYTRPTSEGAGLATTATRRRRSPNAEPHAHAYRPPTDVPTTPNSSMPSVSTKLAMMVGLVGDPVGSERGASAAWAVGSDDPQAEPSGEAPGGPVACIRELGVPWSAQVSQRNGDDEGDHVLRPERGRDQRVVAVQPVRGEDTARRHRRHDDRGRGWPSCRTAWTSYLATSSPCLNAPAR